MIKYFQQLLNKCTKSKKKWLSVSSARANYLSDIGQCVKWRNSENPCTEYVLSNTLNAARPKLIRASRNSVKETMQTPIWDIEWKYNIRLGKKYKFACFIFTISENMFPRDPGIRASTAWPLWRFYMHVYIIPAKDHFLIRVNHTMMSSLSVSAPCTLTVERDVANCPVTMAAMIIKWLVL